MTTVTRQIHSADQVICLNIKALAAQRSLLAQNILSQLRNLVEGVAVLLHRRSPGDEFLYDFVGPALTFARGQARLSFLSRFHKLIQKSSSHYTLDEDNSERLMLKYYDYLLRIRDLVRSECKLEILATLENFPVDLDPSLQEYHEIIAERIEASHSMQGVGGRIDRYYIHKTRPFFIRGRIIYEVTLYSAINKVGKSDRIIAFTDIEIGDKYSARLLIRNDSIQVLDQMMPVTIIRNWQVSIRPCELNNFARLLGFTTRVNASSREYYYLMDFLTVSSGSLLDLMDGSDDEYLGIRTNALADGAQPQIFNVLDRARHIVQSSAPGTNILRYLMLRVHNKILKPLYYANRCNQLSNMHLQYGCIPFETMPFCTSLPSHNPSYWDLVESIDMTGRSHELLARIVRNNVERHGTLYTPRSDLERLGDISILSSTYNNLLYHTHQNRRLVEDRGHIFINGYDEDTISIVRRLQEYASSGIPGYTQAVEHWLSQGPMHVDDAVKANALKHLFTHTRVALIYGAAGTGKSTMVNLIAQFFNDKTKLFLAHTNPAKDNLQRKVSAQGSEFRTIRSQIHRVANDQTYDLLIIDECSTVSNSDLVKVLNKTPSRLLVLVGDVSQIESIQFGNWFEIIKSFIPRTSVFELTTPFRTSSTALLELWKRVRSIDDDIAEILAQNSFCSVLDKTLLKSRNSDEIILCLNYDGLYGINNINRFLQSSNPRESHTWRTTTYKVGDPVLFGETERFRPVIYNNLKGIIVAIESCQEWIQFDVELARTLSSFDISSHELEWIRDSTVRFKVYAYDASDEDDDSLNTTVPFQVAYAVSIHKAQGLEYESVKIVITDANEDDITHSIFYTAITRARNHLKIFWTPETQQAVLERLQHRPNNRDKVLLSSRYGLPMSTQR
jgi:hypothetical protein